MIKTIVRLGLWIVAGSFLGLILPLLIGVAYGMWFSIAKGIFQNWQDLWMIPPAFIIYIVMASSVWGDWVLFSAILGGLSALLFMLLKNLFPSSKPFFFVLVIFPLVIAVCGIFSWQRGLAIKEIESRYVEFCTVLKKNDYVTAYTYMSPQYRQRISLDAFEQKVQNDGDSGVSGGSFLNVCTYSISPKTKNDVSFWQNYSRLFIDGLDFSDPWAGGIFFELEQINGKWYFDGGPVWHGID